MGRTKIALQVQPVKRTSVIGNLKKHWQLFLFLILPLAYIIIFAYGPMLGLQIAFKDFDAAQGIWGSPWVGLKHFKNFIGSYQFTRVLKNTLVTSVYSLVARFPVPPCRRCLHLGLIASYIYHTPLLLRNICFYYDIFAIIGSFQSCFNYCFFSRFYLFFDKCRTFRSAAVSVFYANGYCGFCRMIFCV